MATVCVLAGLDDPDVCLFALSIVVSLLKPTEFWVFQSRLNVESHWQRIVRVLPDRLVVVSHVEEQGFLVR